jgi:2-hydroxy-3-keto-5-methylthiopentenyl-1-phosphate phosphatase
MNKKVLDGSLTFRDSFREMLESVHVPYEECKEALRKSESPQILDWHCYCFLHLSSASPAG